MRVSQVPQVPQKLQISHQMFTTCINQLATKQTILIQGTELTKAQYNDEQFKGNQKGKIQNQPPKGCKQLLSTCMLRISATSRDYCTNR